MLDSGLRRLLEETINTSSKLAVVLLFAEQPRLSTTPMEISQRVCRDIWSVEQALRELAESGVLDCRDGRYRYRPAPEVREALLRLFSAYDEPVGRQEIMWLVHDLDRYAPYRDLLRNGSVTVFST